MKKLLILLFMLPVLLYGQNIVGTKAITYTAGVPTHTPTILGAWVSMDTSTAILRKYNWSTGVWDVMGVYNENLQIVGNNLQLTDGNGLLQVSLSPYLDNTDDQVLSISSDTIYLEDGGFVVLPPSTDTSGYNSSLSVSNDTLFLTDGDGTLFAVLPPSSDTSGYNSSLTLSNDTLYLTDGQGTLFTPLASILSGYVTGSGTTNELPYWATSSSLGSLSTATYPNLTELSYVKGVTSAIQTQLNAKVSGSGTTNYIPKWTSATGQGNSIIYDSGTKVGIGTASPSDKLHVYGTGSGTSGRTWAQIENTQSNSAAGIKLKNGNGRFASFQYSGSGYSVGELFSIFTENDFSILFTTDGAVPSGGTSSIRFSPGGYSSEIARFSSSGLSIGTTSSSARLHVVGPGSTDASPIGLFANSVGSEILKVNGGNGINIGGTGAGLYLQSYSASYAGIWSSLVTPSGTNFALLPGATSTFLNATTTLGFQISGSSKMTATSTGIGIGLTSPTTALDVSGAGTMALFTGTGGTPSRVGINAATGGNAGFDMRFAGTKKWTAAAYLPSGTNYSFTFYNEQTSKAALFINGDTDKASFATDISIGGTTGPSWSSGTGSPEGVVTAPIGSTYSRTDGGTNTATYRKESGTGNTGWVANTTYTLADNVYTPVGTDSTNVSAVTIYQAQYSRVGSTVTVSGFITITPTGAGTCRYDFNPPIASDFTSPFVGCAGNFNDADSHFSGSISANTTSDSIRIAFTAPDGSAHPISYHYTYRIL